MRTREKSNPTSALTSVCSHVYGSRRHLYDVQVSLGRRGLDNGIHDDVVDTGDGEDEG